MKTELLQSVKSHWAMGAIITLMLVSLAGVGFAAAQIGGESTVVGLADVPSPDDQQYAAAAAGPAPTASGTGYLVVWEDDRASIGSNTEWAIYGGFVDTAGNPAGKESFLICQADHNQINPSVAFNAAANEYLVVWSDNRANGYDSAGNPIVYFHIYGARVSTSGTVVDPNGFHISSLTAGLEQNNPVVASNGSTWEVIWEDDYSEVYGIQVAANGTVTGTQLPLGASNNNDPPALAWNGSNYLAVWETWGYEQPNGTGSDIGGQLLSGSGAKFGNALTISATLDTQTNPAVAAGSGGTWLVAWVDKAWGASTEGIFGTPVSGAGAAQAPSGIQIRANTYNQKLPSVGWDGSKFMVAWFDQSVSSDCCGVHVSLTGVVDASPMQISSSSIGTQATAIASGTGECLVVWNTQPSLLDTDIMGRVVVPTGPYGIDKVVSVSAPPQNDFNLCYDGTHFVSVWEDTRSGLSTIYGARTATDDYVLDYGGKPIGAGTGMAELQPAIAWNGKYFLVVWSQNTGGLSMDIVGVRLNQDLSVVDQTPFIICSADGDQIWPQVASNGSNFLVVWTDERSWTGTDEYSDIYGAVVVTSAATPVVTPVTVCTAPNNQDSPAVASDGTNYMVVWTDYPGYRLPPFSITTKTTSPYIQFSPATFTDYVGSIAQWTNNLSTSFNLEILQGSTVIDSAAIASNATLAIDTSSFANGTYTFIEQGTPAVSGTLTLNTPYIENYCSRVSIDSTGKVTVGANTKVSSASSNKQTPKIAWDARDSKYFIVWTDYGSGNGDIYGNTAWWTGSALAFGTEQSICTVANDYKYNPSVTWTGSNYYVAWEDTRNAAGNGDIYVTQTDSAGKAVDSVGQLVSGASYPETMPTVLAWAPDWTSIFYSKSIYTIDRLACRTCGGSTPSTTTMPPIPMANPAEAKWRTDGFSISMANQVVTAGNNVLPGMFYMEDSHRISGIQVDWTQQTVALGDVVSLVGTLGHANGDLNAERIINPVSVVDSSAGVLLAPYSMGMASVGGATLNPSATDNSVTAGVTGGVGPNNIGLLVKVHGLVKSVSAPDFYIDDGSLSGNTLKIVCPTGVTPPVVGKYVTVKGISDSELSGQSYIRKILVRQAGDIQIMK